MFHFHALLWVQYKGSIFLEISSNLDYQFGFHYHISLSYFILSYFSKNGRTALFNYMVLFCFFSHTSECLCKYIMKDAGQYLGNSFRRSSSDLKLVIYKESFHAELVLFNWWLSLTGVIASTFEAKSFQYRFLTHFAATVAGLRSISISISRYNLSFSESCVLERIYSVPGSMASTEINHRETKGCC